MENNKQTIKKVAGILIIIVIIFSTFGFVSKDQAEDFEAKVLKAEVCLTVDTNEDYFECLDELAEAGEIGTEIAEELKAEITDYLSEN